MHSLGISFILARFPVREKLYVALCLLWTHRKAWIHLANNSTVDNILCVSWARLIVISHHLSFSNLGSPSLVRSIALVLYFLFDKGGRIINICGTRLVNLGVLQGLVGITHITVPLLKLAINECGTLIGHLILVTDSECILFHNWLHLFGARYLLRMHLFNESRIDQLLLIVQEPNTVPFYSQYFWINALFLRRLLTRLLHLLSIIIISLTIMLLSIARLILSHRLLQLHCWPLLISLIIFVLSEVLEPGVCIGKMNPIWFCSRSYLIFIWNIFI